MSKDEIEVMEFDGEKLQVVKVYPGQFISPPACLVCPDLGRKSAQVCAGSFNCLCWSEE